jgi:hypothetical protein
VDLDPSHGLRPRQTRGGLLVRPRRAKGSLFCHASDSVALYRHRAMPMHILPHMCAPAAMMCAPCAQFHLSVARSQSLYCSGLVRRRAAAVALSFCLAPLS